MGNFSSLALLATGVIGATMRESMVDKDAQLGNLLLSGSIIALIMKGGTP